MAVAGVMVVLEVSVAEILSCLCCHLLSGQSPPESPWGLLTWRLLLARASCYPARLPPIQLWMSLSRGHSTASSSTSSETAIILKEWVGWVMSSIKLRYFLATLGLIGTQCVTRKGMLHSPAEGFINSNNTQTKRFRRRFEGFSVVSCEQNFKKVAISVTDTAVSEWRYQLCNWDPYLLNCLCELPCVTPLKIYQWNAILVLQRALVNKVFILFIPSTSNSCTSRENIFLSSPCAVIEFAYLFMNLESRNN